MRVLHLATSTSGGAGIAAARIVESQKLIGLDAKLVTRDNQEKTLSTMAKTMVGKSVTVISKFLANHQYGIISPVSVSTLNTKKISEYKPDLINIHNWYNFLSLNDIKKLSLRYPIVFTLHDARMATGGCHVTLGCRNFEKDCVNCPASRSQLLMNRSKLRLDRLLKTLDNYAVVSPSQWMVEEIKKSELYILSNDTMVIRNPIQAPEIHLGELFQNGPIKMSFVSASLDSEFKGLSMMKEALSKLSELSPEISAEVSLAGFSKFKHEINYGAIKVRNVGQLEERGVQTLIRNSDLVLVPSQSDNFPSIITEAQLLGALVIATRVGGIPEMIDDGSSGFLAENSPESFASAIRRAISVKESRGIRQSARNAAVKRVNRTEIARSYLRVYEKLINE
jgi:glycosyltransferase involved in cell wall biosynthesis